MDKDLSAYLTTDEVYDFIIKNASKLLKYDYEKWVSDYKSGKFPNIFFDEGVEIVTICTEYCINHILSLFTNHSDIDNVGYSNLTFILHFKNGTSLKVNKNNRIKNLDINLELHRAEIIIDRTTFFKVPYIARMIQEATNELDDPTLEEVITLKSGIIDDAKNEMFYSLDQLFNYKELNLADDYWQSKTFGYYRKDHEFGTEEFINLTGDRWNELCLSDRRFGLHSRERFLIKRDDLKQWEHIFNEA